MAAYLNEMTSLYVEYVDETTGTVVAKAVRYAIGRAWYIQTLDNTQIVATVSGDLPEVIQRKIVLAILKELI